MASNDLVLNINKDKLGYQYGPISGKLLSKDNVLKNPGSLMISETPLSGRLIQQVRHDIYLQGNHIAGGFGLDTKEDYDKVNNIIKSYISVKPYDPSEDNEVGSFYYKNEGDTIVVYQIDNKKRLKPLSNVPGSESKIYIINGDLYTWNGETLNKISSGLNILEGEGNQSFIPYENLSDDLASSKVGGIDAGEFTVGYMKNMTISEILCEMIFPSEYPTIKVPSVSSKYNSVKLGTIFPNYTKEEDLLNIFEGSVSNNSGNWFGVNIDSIDVVYYDGTKCLNGDIVTEPFMIVGQYSYEEGTTIKDSHGVVISHDNNQFKEYLTEEDRLKGNEEVPFSFICKVDKPYFIYLFDNTSDTEATWKEITNLNDITIISSPDATTEVKTHRVRFALPKGMTPKFLIYNKLSQAWEDDINNAWELIDDMNYDYSLSSNNEMPLTTNSVENGEQYDVWQRGEADPITANYKIRIRL